MPKTPYLWAPPDRKTGPRITELLASLSPLPPSGKRGNFGFAAVQILVRLHPHCGDRATISAKSGIDAIN
jgi:hypothetical protein